MDVRSWDKPQLLHSKLITSGPVNDASFAVGINWVDIDRAGKISIKGYTTNDQSRGVTAHLDALSNTIVYSAGSSLLKVPAHDRDLQTGSFFTQGDQRSWEPWITFDKPYTSIPKVVVWFQEFDFDNTHNWRLRASAESMTTTGFTLKVSTWGDSKLNKAAVTWISYPADSPNITSGSFDTQEVREWYHPRMANHKPIQFEKEFKLPPTVFVGLNEFDVACSSNLRLKALAEDITARGMTLRLDSWFDTTQYTSRADYIAIRAAEELPVGIDAVAPVQPEKNADILGTSKAHINAREGGNVIAKYTLQWSWIEPESGIPVPLAFNINTDNPVPAFKSIGAPDENDLDVQYVPSKGQPYGFCWFSGVIGVNQIYIKIPKWGIVVKGKIEGGPKDGSRFAGNGGWTSG